MKSFLKKALFWILYLPLGVTMLALFIIAGCFEWVAETYGELLDKYERWTFSEELAYGKHNDNYKRNT
jgi:hypothetical protein